MRYWYKEILAEMAESNILQDVMNQIRGTSHTIDKLYPNLGEKIRGANYHLS
jgi:hypothetical protein